MTSHQSLGTPPEPRNRSFFETPMFIVLLVGGTVLLTGMCFVGIVITMVLGGESAYAYQDPYYGEPDPYANDTVQWGSDDYEPYQPPTVGTLDTASGREWSPESYEMSWSEAQAHCGSLRPTGWRLPTRAELQSLVDPTLMAADTANRPLREPFRSSTYGQYLFSGERVGGQSNEPWIMNLANGHVFNGHEYRGVVRCVYEPPW